MRKSNKSELATELKSMLNEKPPSSLPPTIHQRVIIVDFMAYVRKVPIKKKNLKTYSDLFNDLWSTFTFLSSSCNRIDIIFDVYKDQSVKSSERKRRATVEGIETIINTMEQTLPVEMDRFWSLPDNKTALQQTFIDWALRKAVTDKLEKKLYLGGSHKENSDMCISFINGAIKEERLLQCTHEEADDRLLFHANHAVKVGYYRSIVIASADTDIFISTTHLYPQLKFDDLMELWFLSGRGDSRTFFPIHKLSSLLDANFIRVLIPVHDLTGADSISKVGTKTKAAKGRFENSELLSGFGKEEIPEEMISNAEKFLLKCVTKHDVNTFDELRYLVYHEKHLEFNIERFPPTSDSIRQHILRAYLQSYKRLQSAVLEDIPLDPLEYG